MDQADSELRETITHIWPLQAKKMLDLLVPRSDELNAGKLTVGKIYGGLLILESWRNTKFGQLETDAPVSKTIRYYFINLSFSPEISSTPFFCKQINNVLQTLPTLYPQDSRLHLTYSLFLILL